MTDELLRSRDGGVLHLRLNRPDRLNAVTAPLLAALRTALEEAGNDAAIRAVLLSGAGRGFCAGQDLAAVGPEPDLGDTLRTSFNPVIHALRTMPKPVVCAVNGVAAGAGANLAFACDVVLAGEGARFIQAFVKVGLIPDAGGTSFLPRLAGDARARAMAMLGEPVSARQAADWGLIWRCIPDAELEAEAARTAATLASLPTQAIALMKQAFLAAGSNPLDDQLALEAELQGRAGRTPDFREGVAAFVAKRPARFTGAP